MTLKERIEQSFATYAAMTIQHRAIVDARDGLKPAARMAFYSQFLDKITYPKPHRKTHKSVVSAMDHFYVHGDASMIDLLCRLGSPISMRYPIEDTIGNMGTYAELDDHAAPRYTEMRLGEIGTSMLNGIKQNAIPLWFDNFDNTEQFPSVLPSLGFYNIVNGSTGIATSIASSIPQFNLREVNEAMIKLLWNPDISFDEIYCAPDFATGGTILNADEVKESLRKGQGKSAIVRGTIEYDSAENKLLVKEVPYNVATKNIEKQISAMFNPDAPEGISAGIDRFVDSSEEMVDMTIWLSKGAIPQNVVRNLYKHTMIQYHFPINMVMLDKGTRPKVFTWKEALNAHLDHEKEVRRRIHEFELIRIAERLPIVEGIVIALANLDEVISIVRGSQNKTEAKDKLIKRFDYTDAQAEAILKITLSRLVNLEVQSFKDEKETLLAQKEAHEAALADVNVLYKEIEEDLRRIADKFGDERRTKLMNLDYKYKEDEAEPAEQKELLIYYTNLGNFYTQESSTLMRTKRGAKGSKNKFAKNEFVEQMISDVNNNSLLLFTNKGKMHFAYISDLPINGKININSLFKLESGEKPTALTTLSRHSSVKYFVFITKNGMIKKTEAASYNIQRGKTLKAINLKDDDEVVNVMFINDENVGILTNNGNYITIETADIASIGRAAAGVKAIKLNDGDYVIDAKSIKKSDKYMITISKSGLIKKTSMEEFPICSRATKGKKISDVKDDDSIVKFLTISSDCDIIIISKEKTIKISTSELRELSRSAVGVKSFDLKENDYVKDLRGEIDE